MRLARRLRQPLRAFLLTQCAIFASAGAGVLLFVNTPADTPGYRWFYAYWRSLESFRIDPRLYLLLPLVLYGVPTVLMGVSFPILQKAVHDDVKTSGRKVGFLQASNIAGCLLGSLAVGLIFLDSWGTMGTLGAILAVGVGLALLGLSLGGARRPFLVAGATLALLLVAFPSPRRFWLRLHATDDKAAVLREDGTGLVLLRPSGRGEWSLFLNGKFSSSLPFGGIHTALGAVPALIHPNPRQVAIVGLGSGDTAWAAGCRPETVNVTVFELMKGQWPALREVATRSAELPDLMRLLTDPRYVLRVQDGRNAIDRGDARWDVIETDPLRPLSAYSGNIYSTEFFERCARRLRPGGIMCTWAPTPRVGASFRKAFPHVLEGMWNDVMMVGSNDPIPIDRPAWRRRVESQEVSAYLGPTRAREVWARCLETAQTADPPSTMGPTENGDLLPRDEFRSP